MTTERRNVVPLPKLRQGHKPHTIYGEGWYSHNCRQVVRELMAYWHWSITDGMQDRLVRDRVVFG